MKVGFFIAMMVAMTDAVNLQSQNESEFCGLMKWLECHGYGKDGVHHVVQCPQNLPDQLKAVATGQAAPPAGTVAAKPTTTGPQVVTPDSTKPVNLGITPTKDGEAPKIVVNRHGKVIDSDPANKKPATPKELRRMSKIMEEGVKAAEMIKKDAVSDVTAVNGN